MLPTSNAPLFTTMNSFLAQLDMFGSVVKGCRFLVRFTPAGGDNYLTKLPYLLGLSGLTYVCEATELPGRGFNVGDYRYYGPSITLPNQSQYNPANFTFICRSGSLERQFFDDWMDIINPTDSWNFNYPENYYAKIEIFQYAEFGSLPIPNLPIAEITSPQPIYSWTLHRAYPVLVVPQEVNWNDQDYLRLRVTMTYRHWTRTL